MAIEIKMSNRVISKLENIEISEDIQNAFNLELQKQTEKAILTGFGLPKSIIDTGRLQPSISTATSANVQYQLTKEELDRIIDTFFRPKSQDEIMRDTIYQSLRETNISSDDLERCQIALYQLNAIETLKYLPVKQLLDSNFLIETLVKIYKDNLSEF